MRVDDIKTAIVELSPDELSELVKWFEEFQSESWDKQIEEDLEAGKLDKLIKQAEDEFEAGKYRTL